MKSYRELYFYLFDQIAQAVTDLEADHSDTALARLIFAQRQAEEWVIGQEKPPEE